MHIYHWDEWAQNRIKPPYIPGPEFCGTVAAGSDLVHEVFARVEGLKPGGVDKERDLPVAGL